MDGQGGELTLEESIGVRAIIFLQSIADIEETKESALIAWRAFSQEEKDNTMQVYGIMSLIFSDEEGEQETIDD